MSRAKRWMAGVLGAILLLGGVAYLLVWRPVADAATFLRRMTGADPSWKEVEASGGGWWLTAPSLAMGLMPRCLVLDGPTPAAPVVVVVAGVTPEGIDDGRVWRLAVAFRAAGFAVVAPELVRLERPGEGIDPADAVRTALAAARDRANVRWDPERVGLVGVSLGGAVALRALAPDPKHGVPPKGVRAVLLIGTPDDARALAPAWVRLPVAPATAAGEEASRSEAGLFARHAMLRAALPLLVPEGEIAPLRAWVDAIGDHPAGAAALPSGIESPAGRRWVAVAQAENGASPEDAAWALASAAPLLSITSPAAWDADLAALSCPVFLLHGEADPLIPIDEFDRLEARLSRWTSVASLRSRLIAHVSVQSPGFVETWRHLRFLADFFDAVRGGR